jgi:hypothetical protein
MQRAEMRDGIGKHPSNFIFFTHVGFERDGPAAYGFDLVCDFIGRLRVGHIDYDVRTWSDPLRLDTLALQTDTLVGPSIRRRSCHHEARTDAVATAGKLSRSAG